MTLERASELVSELRKVNNHAGYDLFAHFYDLFKLNADSGRQFAELCGYIVAMNANIVRE